MTPKEEPDQPTDEDNQPDEEEDAEPSDAVPQATEAGIKTPGCVGCLMILLGFSIPALFLAYRLHFDPMKWFHHR